MSKVTQDIPGAIPVEEAQQKDEEEAVVDNNISTQATQNSSVQAKTRRNFIGVLIALVSLALIIGLSVGLTQNKTNEGENPQVHENPQVLENVKIFDEAVDLLKSSDLQSNVLPTSGEELSYRVYNTGQPHVLVMLPGYVCNEALFSIIAVLPQFADHTIIAVNPIGWAGSSMNTPISSHEENADAVVELLNMMGIKKAMVGGYSTGGGIAFHMAHKYPDVIKAAFLFHSIPLDGSKFFNEDGSPGNATDIAAQYASLLPDDIGGEAFVETLKAFSPKSTGFPPPEHSITKYLVEAVQMPGKHEAIMNNINFNVSPIKTPYAEPSDALSSLKAKVIVIHGIDDNAVDGEQVELVTKLAIKENWAAPGMLSFYDSGEGHMLFFDNPTALASIYRQAFEEQVVSKDESD